MMPRGLQSSPVSNASVLCSCNGNKSVKPGDRDIFYNKRPKMTRKNFMGSTTHSRSQSRLHEIFSGLFVLFVVQKELSRYRFH